MPFLTTYLISSAVWGAVVAAVNRAAVNQSPIVRRTAQMMDKKSVKDAKREVQYLSYTKGAIYGLAMPISAPVVVIDRLWGRDARHIVPGAQFRCSHAAPNCCQFDYCHPLSLAASTLIIRRSTSKPK